MSEPEDDRMQCRCVSNVIKSLEREGGNTELVTSFTINFKTGKSATWPVIATQKKNTRSREKARTILPSFCPFCGKSTKRATPRKKK